MHIFVILICVFVTLIVFNMDYSDQPEGPVALFWSVLIMIGIVLWALI